MFAIVIWLLNIYILLIIARALISWGSVDPRHPAVQFLTRVTEPLLGPLRRLAPPEKLSGIDVSPLLAIIVIQIIKYLLIGALTR